MSFSKQILNTILLTALASSACAIAQQPMLLANLPEADPASNPAATPETAVTKPAVAPDKTTALSGKIDRWVDVDDLSFSFRYRNEMRNDGYRLFDNAQQKSLVVADLKLDPEAKYSVHLRVSSGRIFNWAFSDEIGDDSRKRLLSPAAAGILTPPRLAGLYAVLAADPASIADLDVSVSRGWEMSFRELYFRASPVKRVAVEFGSLGIEKGVSTEATTYDDDGYLTGERVRLFAPKRLFFDQVAATFAYEGDIYNPSFFARGQRLGQENYRQLFVAKKFGSRFDTSADYTFDKGTHTLHQAAFVKLPEIKAIDSVRLELYQRLNEHMISGETYHPHQGFAVTGTKTFHKKFQLDGGAAHIDYDYGVLTGDRLLAWAGFSMNGDSYLTGTRAFTRANFKAANGVTFYGYFTHTITDTSPASLLLNKQGLNGGMTVDLKKLVNTKQRIF